MTLYKNFLYLIVFSFFLLSCSQTSEDNTNIDNTNIDNENGSSDISSSISGVVVDGYIQNAIVCIDVNLNLLCDANEQTQTTNELGKYFFASVSLGKNKIIPIISNHGYDTSTNENFNEEIVGFVSTYDVKTSYETIVSPATDLIMRKSVQENFRNTLTFSSYEVADPLSNKITFVLIQKLQHLKNLIKESNALISIQDIKNEILKQNLRLEIDNLNIEIIFSNLEKKYNIVIDSRKKEFIIAQISANKESLNSLIFDTYVEMEGLSDMQVSINNDMKKAYERINNFDNNTSGIELEEFNSILKKSRNIIEMPKNRFYDIPPALPKFD
jgi:hypothetical protein